MDLGSSINCPSQEHTTSEAPKCLWPGMTSTAWEGWGTLHVKPHVAACYYFSATAAMQVAGTCCLIGMPDFRALGPVSLLAFLVYGVLLGLAFWRYGPCVVVHNRLYPAALLLYAILGLPSMLMGYLGSSDMAPYGNKLLFIGLNTVGMFGASHMMAAGGSKGEHPAQPRASILWPCVRGTIRAVQVMDALTNLAVIRTLLDQACPHPHSSGTWYSHVSLMVLHLFKGRS